MTAITGDGLGRCRQHHAPWHASLRARTRGCSMRPSPDTPLMTPSTHTALAPAREAPLGQPSAAPDRTPGSPLGHRRNRGPGQFRAPGRDPGSDARLGSRPSQEPRTGANFRAPAPQAPGGGTPTQGVMGPTPWRPHLPAPHCARARPPRTAIGGPAPTLGSPLGHRGNRGPSGQSPRSRAATPAEVPPRAGQGGGSMGPIGGGSPLPREAARAK
jgi:hypothetical protein